MAPEIKLKVLFIYSNEDQIAQAELEPYLQSKVIVPFIYSLKYQKIETLNPAAFSTAIKEYDLIIFLISMKLLTHNFITSPVVKKVLYYHQMKWLAIAQIRLNKVIKEDNIFDKASPFPKKKVIVDKSWKSRNHAYKSTIKSLKLFIKKIHAEKVKLEHAWKAAQTTNLHQSYSDFLKEFPLSRYSRRAKKKKDNLLDIELWKKARKKNTVKAYYEFIMKTPLERHKFKAALKIYEIEENSTAQWIDIQENKNLKLYYHYINKFPDEPNAVLAKGEINSRLPNYNQLAEVNLENLNSNYLGFYKYRELRGEELFALHTHTKHFNLLKEVLEEKYEKKIRAHQFYPFIASIISFIIIWSIWGILNTIFNLPIGSINSLLAQLFLVAIFIIFLLQYINARSFMRKDECYIKMALKSLIGLSILSRAYQTNKSQVLVKTQLETAKLIEERSNNIVKKGFWNYIFPSPDDRPNFEELPIRE